MKRVLIVTYYWPPTGGSGVQRWVKFSKYLPGYGWQPVIYTPENPEQLAFDESLLRDIPEEAEVIKTRIVEPYGIYRKLLGKKTREVNPVNSRKKGLAARISMWIRGNLFVPDPRILWVRPSVKYLKKYLKEHPVDVVVTSGPPQSMHLIGLGLKKALGIKWIVDFRDPWTEMFYYKHLGLSKCADRKQHKLEQQVLDSADRIIAVTPFVQKEFREKTNTPVELLTNGFDECDFRQERTKRTDGKFRIVHTGLFAADGDPDRLWEALSELCRDDGSFAEKLEIRLAGKTDSAILDSIKAHGLEDNLTDLGYLPHDEIVREQQAADILILPLRKEPEYAKVYPGKIFEYMASNRPVLGIGVSDGASALLLEDSGAGRMFDWEDKDNIKAYILYPEREAKNIEKYTRKRLTERLTKML